QETRLLDPCAVVRQDLGGQTRGELVGHEMNSITELGLIDGKGMSKRGKIRLDAYPCLAREALQAALAFAAGSTCAGKSAILSTRRVDIPPRKEAPMTASDEH